MICREEEGAAGHVEEELDGFKDLQRAIGHAAVQIVDEDGEQLVTVPDVIVDQSAQIRWGRLPGVASAGDRRRLLRRGRR